MFAKLSEEYHSKKYYIPCLISLSAGAGRRAWKEGQTGTPDSTSASDLREEERETSKWEVVDYGALVIQLLAGCLCSQH